LRFFALHPLDLSAIKQEDLKMSKLKTLISTTITPIALCLTLGISAPVLAHKGHHQKYDGMRQILSELSLTDTQKQDVKQIFKQTRADRELFSSDEKTLKQELRSLINSSEWDQLAVENNITQQQTIIHTKALQRATNKNQVWNLLTETQQGELVTQFEARKAERTEKKSTGKKKGNKQKHLKLTEEQIVAVRAIKNTTKESGKEIKVKLKSYKQAERSLVQSKDFNAEAWQALNTDYQADFATMAMLKAKSKHDMWNLMTPEQQAKVLERSEKGKRGKKGKKIKGDNKYARAESV
jgi:protein CpxP